MKNFLSRPDELGRSFEQGMSSASSQVKNAAKAVAQDITQQVKPAPPKQEDNTDWLQALYGRSTASQDQRASGADESTTPEVISETPPPTRDEQRGDQGVEALNPQKQQQHQQKHVDRHKMTYWEPLFGEERRKKLQQQEQQEEQVEEQEEQNERWQLEDKKKKQNNEIVKAQTKRETGVGNAGG